MAQKNKNSKTRYSKAKPIGLRSQRVAKVRRSVKQVPAKRKRTVMKLAAAPLQVRWKSNKSIRPKRLVSKYSARRMQVQRRSVAAQFFRHALTRSAMVLVLLGLFTATLVSRASTDAQTYRALPTNCTGWNAADNVKIIEASSDANGQAIPADKSATIQSRKADQPASGDPQLKCKSFALPDDFPKDVAIRSAQLLVSLAVQGNPDSEDVLVLESSFDGQQWNKLDSFFLTEDMSNATNGGYWAYPFAKLEPDGIGTLQVRARFVSVPSDKQVSVRIDGMALEVNVRQVVSAEALKLPTNVVQMDQANVATTDEPVVKVEVGKQARLKFLGFKDTKRTVDEVTVTTPEGTVQAATYDTQNITQGTTTYAKLNIHTDKFTKPGKYTAQVTVLQDNKLAIVTTEFTWGVLVINMNRSVYWPGETVFFGMGVLDPDGHTVCDARLVLTVVAPDGTKTVKTTEQTENGVHRSTTCGRDNVTDVADYSAEYDTADAGNYAVTLTAKTASGEYTITDTVVVSPVIPFAISRRGSMRIYPPAAYTMALDVRPQQAFKGIVEDYVPPSFAVTMVSDGGKVIKGQQRTTIRWQVNWQDHTTHTLTYRYDAPDISPELFRLGPVQVGDYQESRQWQIASDAAGSATATRLFTIGFEMQTPGGSGAASSASGGPAEYTANINAPLNDTTTFRSGAASLETLVSGSAATEGARLRVADANTVDDFYFRAYINITTLPSALTQVMLVENAAGTDLISIKMNTTGTLELWNDEDAGQLGSDSSLALSPGTWYRLELRVDCTSTCAGAAGNVPVEAQIDGATFASVTNVNLATGFRDFKWGILQNATAEFNWDDIAVNNDSTAATEQNWPGAGKVVAMRPSSDGTNVAWTGTFADVDDTAGVDTTYAVCSGNGQLEDYNLTDPSAITAFDNVILVQPNVRQTTTATLSHSWTIALYSGATDNDISGTVAVNQSTAFGVNDDIYATTTVEAPTPPNVTAYDYPGAASTTNDPWTSTSLNAATVRLASVDCSPVVRVTEIWVNVEYVPAEGGRLWTSGFELQSVTAGMEFTATVSTAPTIDTTTKRSGAASLRTNVSSSTSVMSYDFASADVTDDFFVRTYFRMATRPNSKSIIMAINDNAGTNQASIRYDNANNTLELWNEEGGVQVGSDSSLAMAIAANTWYMLELKVNATTIATTGLTARLNSVAFANGTVNHANGVKTLQLGVILTGGAGSTADIYWDDVAINRGMGVTQNTYPGPGAVVAMQADAVGDNTAWTISVSCAAVDYTCVNEIPPNDATTAVASSTLQQIEDNNFETSANAGIGANDTITLVQAGIRFNVSTAVVGGVKVRMKAAAGGGAIESDNITTASTTWTTNRSSGPLTYPITAYTPPNLETAWTAAALDAAQVGVRLTVDPTGNFQLSNMWLMVEYKPLILVTSAMYQTDEATGANCQTQTAYAECDVIISSSGGSTAIVSTTTNAATSPISGYVNAPLNVGDPVAIYVSGLGGFEILYAATVVIASSISADITTNNTLYQNEVVLSNLGAVAVTNTLLAAAAFPTTATGDVGMRYTVTSGSLAVDSGMKLYVLSGKTFTAGGAVTTTSAGVHLASSAAFTTGGTTTIGGNLDIDASATMTVGAFDLSVTGTTGITGTMTYSSATGAKLLTGAVTINANGTWTNSGPAAVTFRGGLTNNSAVSHTWGTVTYTFDTNDQSIGGSGAITMSTVVTGTAAKTLTNTGTLTISAALNGGGNFTNSTSATLNVNFTGALGMSGTFTANAANNTVSWGFGGTQTVSPVAYYNLTLATSGVKTLTNVTTIGGNLTLSGTASATITSVMTITLDIIAGTGTTLTIGASTNVNGGDIATTTTAIIASSGTPTVTISGTGTIGGGSGAITIYNLVTTGTGTTTWTNSGTNTVSTNVSVGAGTTLNLNSTITITGNLTNTTSGNIGNTAGTPTIFVNGTTIGGGTTGAITLYRLTKGGASVTTFTNGGTNTITNWLVVGSSSTLNLNSSISIGGDVSNVGIIGNTAGTPTISVSGTAVGDPASASAMTFYRLDKTGAGSSTLDCWNCTISVSTNLNVTAGTLSINNALTVTGNVSVSTAATLSLLASMNVNGGSVTTAGTAVINAPSANTLTISGTGSIGGGTTGNITLSSLTTTGSGTTTFTNGGTNLVNVNVSVGAGTTLNFNSTITVAGNLTNTTSGIIGTTAGTPTVNVQGTSIGGGTTGAITFYNLGKTGGTTTTFTNGGTNTVNNNVSVTVGTLVLASPLTVTGDVNSVAAGTTLTINASLNVNGGDIVNATSGIINTTSGTPTVTISSTGGIGGGTTGAITFYNLTTSGTGTTTFLNGGTNTINNDIAVGAGTTLNINSSVALAGSLTNATSGIIGTSAGTPTITMSGAAKTIGGGTTGAITLYALTLNGTASVTFTNGGTNTISNDVAVGAGTTLNLNSTIGITGSLTNATSGIISTSAGTPTVSVSGTSIGGGTTGAITFYNLTKAGAGTTTFTNGGTNTVNHDLVISAGTFVAPVGTLNIGGSFTNSAAFTHSSGTIALTTAAAATISGSTTFNNLSVSGIGAAKVITFTAGTTQTVVGIWTVTGAVGQVITLQSSAASAWTINPTAASVDYTTVSWSNSGLSICAMHSTDGLNNNANWTFTTGASCGIDVAGTSNSSGGTVKVAVNGSLQGQTTTLAASWTISSVTVNSGDKVTVFVDAAADAAETTGVTKYDGTGNIGGLVLDTNVLTVGSDDNASLILTDLGLYDNDQSEDVMHTANVSVLTVDDDAVYSTEQITIKASNTLTIGTTETLATYHLNNAGVLVGTGSATFDVFGNWTNSSTFTHNTSTVTFKSTGTGKTINNGASSFYNVTFNGSGGAWSPLTNTLTVTNDLTMTNGTFNTATGTANVTVNGNVQCLTTCGTITMNSAGTNTFTQSVATSKAFGTNVAVATDWTFYNLTFTASAGTPTITTNATGTGQIIVANTLTTTNSGTSLIVDNETNDRIIDANGAVTIGAGTTLQASSTVAFNVAGNWTNNGDFTDGSGTVTLDGGSQQTVDGQLTGASDRFNNLIITNASGSNPETSPSVIFAASADTASTFTAATASTKLRFLAGGTYTFQNISFNGGAIGTRVALRSSSTGTSWALNVAGTRTVTKTDVRDSNACGQAPEIDATDGTNFDSIGNSCWQINTLTFVINDVAVGFGSLTSGAARWANAGATGSGSAVAAHTLAVTTNARGGYALTYFGPTLVGTETIDAATFTGDADGSPGSKQFAMSITTDGDGTIPVAYQKSSNNYSFVPSTTTTLMSETGPTATETASVYYLANIAQTTLPGAYSTNITYIVTSTF